MIPADTARCPGITGEPKCQVCARRLQMKKDTPDRWFPVMAPPIARGYCMCWIDSGDDQK